MPITDDAVSGDESEMTPERVSEFLRHHPDFLLEHLDRIVPPQARWEKGKVIDLQEVMVRRLRGQVDTLRGCTDELLHTTRNNMSTQARTHRAVLAVIAAEGFESLCQVVGEDLPALLDVDSVVLCLEAEIPPPGGPVTTLAPGHMDRLLGQRQTLLRENVKGDPALFGEAAASIRSDALVRLDLGEEMPQALLALGSLHSDAFHARQGAELLTFLANVLEWSLKRWLSAPG